MESTPPKAKIYTKTGDKGKTYLVDGSCVEKFNPRVEAYGCIDELNSYLGLARAYIFQENEIYLIDQDLEKIQNDLFSIGSLLACESEDIFLKLPHLSEKDVAFLELKIDLMTMDLPELKNFILPAGHIVTAHLHIARTLCRRAERRSVEIFLQSSRYDLYLRYLNRLSDYLFVAARWTQKKMNLPEVIWKNK